MYGSGEALERRDGGAPREGLWPRPPWMTESLRSSKREERGGGREGEGAWRPSLAHSFPAPLVGTGRAGGAPEGHRATGSGHQCEGPSEADQTIGVVVCASEALSCIGEIRVSRLEHHRWWPWPLCVAPGGPSAACHPQEFIPWWPQASALCRRCGLGGAKGFRRH